MHLTLRPATPDDREFFARLHERCYREVVTAQFGAWDPALQATLLARKWDPARFAIVLLDGRAVGSLAVDRHPDHCFLADVMVDPSVQGRGVGTELVRRVIAEAAAAGLPVRLQVLHRNRARALYERLGFTATGETETHVRMERRN